jgi:hypothetical protein
MSELEDLVLAGRNCLEDQPEVLVDGESLCEALSTIQAHGIRGVWLLPIDIHRMLHAAFELGIGLAAVREVR